MQEQEVIMGTLDPGYKMGKARMITFCVTEECNLRCKYCYMTDKNSFNRMSFDIAKKAVDVLYIPVAGIILAGPVLKKAKIILHGISF